MHLSKISLLLLNLTRVVIGVSQNIIIAQPQINVFKNTTCSVPRDATVKEF